ncbi:MAG: hypothetical protein ACT4PV_13890 [Planctomycetaceae bacterium]
MRRRLLLLAVACAACATTPGKGAEGESPATFALRRPTQVKARTAELILSDRLRPEAKLTAVRVETREDGKLLARGEAVLVLRHLRVECSESILVAYLPDHESLFLLARQVERFRQQDGYGHSTEQASAVSIADDRVTILP